MPSKHDAIHSWVLCGACTRHPHKRWGRPGLGSVEMDKGQVFICGGGWTDGTSCRVRCRRRGRGGPRPPPGFLSKSLGGRGHPGERQQDTLRAEKAGGDLGLPRGQGLPCDGRCKTGTQAGLSKVPILP